ncbi:MAG: DUF6175 family protein [Lentisphaeria bacterium]|nr:DUF6175 family protein [Candidatus Neomarinimicrobiota bacterium]MCF7842996.1 DUF6175 family protein [Lentisphaeria bacterium]
MKHSIATFALVFGLATILSAQSNVPRSKEALFIESSGPSEVILAATGIGTAKTNWLGKVDQEELTTSAKLDARRAAIWFVVLGGSDPILTTDGEKSKFAGIQESFFEAQNINKYIAWESDRFEERVKIDDGKKLRIKRLMRVNTRLVKDDLVALGVTTAQADLTEKMGLPTIMVLPEAPKGRYPLDLLKSDKTLKKGAEVIESYLTARRYDVIVPEQQEGLQDLVSASQTLKDVEDDPTYLIALSVGADVYITYNVTTESRRVGSREVKKAAVAVRAFETTTGRLLGTETGYSAERPTMDAAVIEEGINDAIEKVLARITAYWKDDLARGLQYKVIISVSTDFSTSEAEDIMFEVMDVFDDMAKTTKEILMTDYTLDYLIWADYERYDRSSNVYRDLKRAIEKAVPDGSLRRVALNRKLVVLSVEME